MKILNFKGFMKKHYSKNSTMNEFDLQRVYDYPINIRDCKIYSDRAFVNRDIGS